MGIRKSQYHFRWDWGPELLCIGPDRPIHLKLYSARLKAVKTAARVGKELKKILAVSVEANDGKRWKVSLSDSKGGVVKQEICEGPVEWKVDEVKLWWPVGHGAQPLYTVKVELLGSVRKELLGEADEQDQEVLDAVTRKVGFRRSKLIQEPLEGQEGTTFLFEINNKRIFMGGEDLLQVKATHADQV